MLRQKSHIEKLGHTVKFQEAVQSSNAVFSACFYGAMAKWSRHYIPNPGVPCAKPLGGSMVDSAFHPSEVGQMSTRNFWELSGKK